MMTERDLLSEAAEYAFARFEAVEERLERLAEPLRTFVIVYSAQAIIDNGGLEYFFSNNFPDNPPYRLFISAYELIGAQQAAQAIDQSLGFFSMDRPERDQAARLAFIESLPEDDTHPFCRLSLQICGDERVWSCLETYVYEQLPAFGLVRPH